MKMVKIELRFDKTELQWIAEINGEHYGAHRWEHRAFLLARQRYEDRFGTEPSAVDFEMVIEWPRKIQKARDLVGKKMKEMQRVERMLKDAQHEYHKAIGMFIAGWKDCGMSHKTATQVAEVSVNTGNKYIEFSGDDNAAAANLWSSLGVKSDGILGRKSERTRPTMAQTKR